MNKSDFLARVRRALKRQSGDPVEAPPTPAPPLAEWDSVDLAEAFSAELCAVGSHIWLADGMAGARQVLKRLLEEMGARTFVRSSDPLVDDAAGVMWELGLEPAEAADADVGVSGVRCTIAATGTLVLTSETGRQASLLPMTHIALVRRHQLVPSLSEALVLYGDALPSAWVQATGPSRTADIELTLTTGVHGPGVVHVILIR